jgi:hypothetical protein
MAPPYIQQCQGRLSFLRAGPKAVIINGNDRFFFTTGMSADIEGWFAYTAMLLAILLKTSTFKE